MAGRIPQNFIDELLGRIDISDVIDARVPLKSVGRGEFKACCPFHEEKTPSFTVSSNKQFYHCFGCGAHGTAVGFLMEYAHLSFVEAIEELAANAGVDVPYEQSSNFQPTRPSNESKNLIEFLQSANQYYKNQLRADSEQAKKAIEYLKNRGLSGATARDFEIGLATDAWDGLVKSLGNNTQAINKLKQAGLINQRDSGGHYDRFRDRIIFPIHNFKGQVVAFGGRVLGQGEPKYLNSPETPVFHKGSELYNLHRAVGSIKSAQFALVVEGYMDVIALAEHGIGNAVATLGTATTRSHLERLFRHTDTIVFCFDGDKAGERAAWRALENVLPVIVDGRIVKFLFLPTGHDPDSLVQQEGKQALEQRIAKAQSLSQFLLEKLQSQTDLSHAEGRAKLLSLAKPYMDKLNEGSLKQILLEQLTSLAKTNAGQSLHGNQPGYLASGQRPSAKKNQSTSDKLSPMAKLISLLVQFPALNQQYSEQIKALAGLQLSGLDLLTKLSELLDREQSLSCAALLERFRETAEHSALEKLATYHHLITEQALLSEEFAEILASMKLQRLDQLAQQLMDQVNSGQLTEEQAANQLKTLHNQRLKNSDI